MDPFVVNRAALYAAAYRMLGTQVDAEDVLQEAWLRWSRVDASTLRNPRAYLFRLVANEAIDQLRRVRTRREEYIGPWLPEPHIDDAGGPSELADSASVGLLVVLETLAPDERAVFVLHEAFAFSHAEIAAMLDRSEHAVRQLAYRARRHIRAGRPRQHPTPAEHRELTSRFVAAAVQGDVAGLLRLLAPNAVLHADADGQRETPRRPLHGASAIAHWFRTAAPFWPPRLTVHPTAVNGGPGALICGDGAAFLLFALEFDDTNQVRGIYAQLNPAKLPARPTASR